MFFYVWLFQILESFGVIWNKFGINHGIDRAMKKNVFLRLVIPNFGIIWSNLE